MELKDLDKTLQLLSKLLKYQDLPLHYLARLRQLHRGFDIWAEEVRRWEKNRPAHLKGPLILATDTTGEGTGEDPMELLLRDPLAEAEHGTGGPQETAGDA